MKLGIVGLPNVGKSTLFNAITKAGAECANYPFCTIEPNVGTVPVKDERIDSLTLMYKPKKTIYATIEFVDIAGLVKGASRGEGLGNKFLSHVREVDAIVHVVRCFDDLNVTHVEGDVNPVRDIEIINLELILADLEVLERRMDKAKKMLKGDKKFQNEIEVLEKVKAVLEDQKSIRNMDFTEEEREIVESMGFLTLKPVIYAGNLSEDDFSCPENNSYFNRLNIFAESENTVALPISAKIEEELSQLSDDDKDLFIKEIGVAESGLDMLIKVGYDILGLMSFLTAGPEEVRAWTIKKNTKAPKAAGKIHTDFERGFIRAEIINFNDLMASGNMTVAKENGLVRLEGKEYIMADGDVVLFRFNV